MGGFYHGFCVRGLRANVNWKLLESDDVILKIEGDGL